jgi:predicted RNA binding protein YcfA (HicA-like mRNA interferase family)
MPRLTPVSWKRFEKILLSLGFELARTEGSHRCYVKLGIKRPVVIPVHGAEIEVSVIQSNLKTMGIDRGEYLRILEKI